MTDSIAEVSSSPEVQPSLEQSSAPVGTVEQQPQANASGEPTGAERQPEHRRPDAIPYPRFQDVVRERNELRTRLQEHEIRTQQAQRQDQRPSESPPDPSLYDSKDAYLHAVEKWADSRAEARTSASVHQTRQQAELMGIAQRFNAGVEKIAATAPEIGEAVQFFASFEGLNPNLFREVVADENGPAIALEIAKDPEWGEKLFSASPMVAGRMIAQRIGSQTTTQLARQAVPVTKTVAGSAHAGETDPSKMSREQYFAWREKQER